MQEINLYDLLKYYARNWATLLTALFVGAIIGLVYTFYLQQPLYKSEATMLVVGARTSQDATINNNYTELFKSRRVLGNVIQQQGYDGDYDQLLARTTATNDKNTDVLKVSIADDSAAKGQQLLQASLEAFRKEAGELYERDNIKVVDPANLPSEPYNVKVVLQVGLAMAATFFFAIIVMFFVYDYRMSNGTPTGESTPAKKSATPKTSSKGKGKSPTAKAGSKKKPASTATVQPRRNLWQRFSYLLVGSSDTTTSATKKTK